MKLIAGKLKTKWEGPFTVVQIFLYGVVEIQELNFGRNFKVNGIDSNIFKKEENATRKIGFIHGLLPTDLYL